MRILFLVVMLLCTSHAYSAQNGTGFQTWMQEFRQEAIKAGISRSTVEQALDDLQYKERVIELDRKQPESRLTFTEYRERIVSPTRIRQGRARLEEHRAALERASRRYGVAPQYIVALWGIETSYGAITGGFNVIESLATLAYDGRRGEFFTGELIEALRIIDQGHVGPDAMTGSWAGALGQNQFMPSSFHRFAVDGDGDGQADIWGNLDDVFASTANYLAQNGWQEGERWGRPVTLPADFRDSLIGLDVRRPLSAWAAAGVKRRDGGGIPTTDGFSASIIAPDGLGGPAFLVYENYRVFLRWNRSSYFATSVGLLADSIAGR